MAYSRITINSFLRKVLRATEDDGENDLDAAILVFEAIQDSEYTTVTAATGQVINTTANGKSVSISVEAGITHQDLFEISDVCISVLENGGTRLPDRALGRF